jgi:hypothetical protein
MPLPIIIMRQFYELDMTLGESYIEGMATCGDKQYRINIQGGSTCLILPSKFEGAAADHAIIIFATRDGNNQQIETKVQYDKDWIQVYDDNLTAALSNDLPIMMIIDSI